MITQSKLSATAFYASLLTFAAFAGYLLSVNAEVFYTAHDRSEFLVGAPFFQTLLSKPFGLMQYAGAWLTQFFYKPAVGSAILAALWLLTFVVGIRAFRLQGAARGMMLLPIAFLLTSVVDLGYWIYVFPVRGYWFSQSLAYLAMLLLLWIARSTPRPWHLAWYLVGLGLYPVLGWFALLFVICLAFTEKTTWRELLGVVLLLFIANIWRALLYTNVKLDDVLMAGFPRMVNPSNQTDYLSMPFWLLGVASILLTPLSRYLNRWFVPVLSVAVAIIFTWSMHFDDRGYIDEMRMVRHAEAGQWQEVLQVAEENPDLTPSMVMLKNVALMKEGGLLNRSFQLGNSSCNICNPDSLQVSFLEIASPIVYYHYGLINEGFRLAFECGEQTGFSPFYLKMLCQCAYANGEAPLVKRYLAQLHGLPYYKNWHPAPVSQDTRELKACYPDELTGVENSFSYLVNSVSLWYGSDSRVASEQALFYAMMRCDSRRFWPSLRNFIKLHQNEEFPLHAQEAYILYYDKAPEEKRMRIAVSEDIYERYKQFWATLEEMVREGVNQREIPEKMRADFGDTYWYYNIFGRKIL